VASSSKLYSSEEKKKWQEKNRLSCNKYEDVKVETINLLTSGKKDTLNTAQSNQSQLKQT